MYHPNSTRLVLILSTFPQQSETFIVSKFLGLSSRGWDIHIICNQHHRNAWPLFPDLVADPTIRKQIHPAWPVEPRWLVPLLFPVSLAACLLSAPRLTCRYLRKGWRRFGWDIFHRFYLDARLIRIRPDILHFEFGALAVGRTYLKELLGCQLSVSFRGYDLNFVALDEPDYYAELWDALDGCHLLSEHLWQRALARGCPLELDHKLIPPAVDLTIYPEPRSHQDEALGTPKYPLRILSVGRLEWKKGYEHALQAIRILQERGVSCEYRIVGGGEYRDPLHFARYQMGLEEAVTFCGSMDHPGVLEKLSRADVFLHPSLSEGFCNAVLEAQAMGVPVVCTDAGGLPENVIDGLTGFVVPRRDPAAMADKLSLLAGNPDLRRKMGAAGRQRVEAHFRMDQQLDAFEDFYESL